MKKGITRIILVSIAAGLLVAAMLWLITQRLQQPFFSPPDDPRKWARQEFEETFSPSPAGSLPDLKMSPPPAFSIHRFPDKIELTLAEDPVSAPTREHHEIFLPDGNGEVTLPGGNRLRLEAVALVQNADIDWSDKSYTDLDPDWRDPNTLEPLPKAKTKGWPTRRMQKQNPSMLLLRISNTGENPLRWYGADVYDDRTRMRIANSSQFHSHTQHGRFGIEQLIWHQTPLRIAINFAFGDPEYRDLELKKDAEVRFGDLALVRVIQAGSRPINSSSWGGKQASFGFGKVGRQKNRSAVLHVWPPHQHGMLDFKATARNGKTHEQAIWGSDGFAEIEFYGDFAEVESVRVRRFPKLGRAVFALPRIPGLPEVDNLFEAPIPRVTLNYQGDFRDIISKSAGIQWQIYQTTLPSSLFPLTLEDTTPAEALKTFEELSRNRAYFNFDTLTVSDKPPAGMMEQLRQWWQRNKPGWLP